LEALTWNDRSINSTVSGEWVRSAKLALTQRVGNGAGEVTPRKVGERMPRVCTHYEQTVTFPPKRWRHVPDLIVSIQDRNVVAPRLYTRLDDVDGIGDHPLHHPCAATC